VSVPDDDLLGTAAQKSLYRGIGFAGEQLAHLLIFGIGLVLSANPADTFGVSNHEYGLFLGKDCGAAQEHKTE
jgi:hypothetical protein